MAEHSGIQSGPLPSSARLEGDPANAAHAVTAITVNARRLVLVVFLVCLTVEILLFLYDYHLHYRGVLPSAPLRRLFNMTREDSLASWFGIMQAALVALTLWLLVWLKRHQDMPRATIWGWLLLAAFFTYMAVDDGIVLHERIGDAVADAFEPEEGSLTGPIAWFPSYYWQMVFLPPLAALGLFTLAFLWRQLPDRWSRLMVFAALSLFVLAVALDFVEGLAQEHPWNIYAWMAESDALERFARSRFDRSAFESLVHFSKSLEETLEMLANTLLWCVFLRHLTLTVPELRLLFQRP